MIVCEEKDYRNGSTLGEILKSINDPWVPGEIEVKAVGEYMMCSALHRPELTWSANAGVWDTVGSLGMPYSLSKMGRSEDEVRAILVILAGCKPFSPL